MYRTGLGALPSWIQGVSFQLPPVTISLPGGAVIAPLQATVPATVQAPKPSMPNVLQWLLPIGLVVGVAAFARRARGG
jgi:hypothetical protein